MGASESCHTIGELTVRRRAAGAARILFGLVWAIDAFFKWQPDFYTKFTSYISGAAQGQAPWVVSWLDFWVNLVKGAPATFGILVAIIETLIAAGLILGVFSNLVQLGGGLFALAIWTTAEGFGGPYAPGSTDVGTAVIYAILFIALFASRSGMSLGLDGLLTPRLGRFGFLASGSLLRERVREKGALHTVGGSRHYGEVR